MPSPAEEAKGIVATWFKWADRGMFIGHCDKKALQRLEEAIARAMALSIAQALAEETEADKPKPKAKAKPKGEAA